MVSRLLLVYPLQLDSQRARECPRYIGSQSYSVIPFGTIFDGFRCENLVTMRWGYDVCNTIARTTGLFTQIIYIDALELGIRAEYVEVLVTRKPATDQENNRYRAR